MKLDAFRSQNIVRFLVGGPDICPPNSFPTCRALLWAAGDWDLQTNCSRPFPAGRLTCGSDPGKEAQWEE